MAAWLAILAAMSTWGWTDAALAGAALASVALGAVVGRFPVILVPVALGLAAAVATLLAGDDPEDSDGTSAEAWALYISIWTAAISVLVALGVLARRGVAGVRR